MDYRRMHDSCCENQSGKRGTLLMASPVSEYVVATRDADRVRGRVAGYVRATLPSQQVL